MNLITEQRHEDARRKHWGESACEEYQPDDPVGTNAAVGSGPARAVVVDGHCHVYDISGGLVDQGPLADMQKHLRGIPVHQR